MTQGLLQGKVALITGASEGIGRGIAELFVEHGVAVALNGRREPPLEALAEKFRRQGAVAHAISADVGDEAAVINLFSQVDRLLGPLDVLVNSAGGGHGAVCLEELQSQDLWGVIKVDLVGTLLCCREAVRRMRGRGGAIVNVSSQGGRSISDLAGAHYAAAKAGVLGLTRQLARDYGPDGIRVNAIAPGITLSRRIQAKLNARSPEDRHRLLAAIPLGRFAEPQDIALVALFLASDLSRYVTGATIDTNGGRFMA